MRFLKLVVFCVIVILSQTLSAQTISPLTWPQIKMENKPGVYWWWLGSAVDKENLTYNLETLHKAGIGGVTVVPIYGARGWEKQWINYLSPKWVEMLAYAVKEAQRLNMWVDMTTGTGWPFGGSHITPEYAAKKVEFKKYNLAKGERLREKTDKAGLQTLMAFSDQGDRLDLTEKIDGNGMLQWTPDSDHWTLYAVRQTGTGQKVKRAAPGNEGLVIDPYSLKSLDFYLRRFNKAFAGYKGPFPRAQYHDSFEYYNADWTDDLFQEFQKRRGYDLRNYLPLLFGDGDADAVGRVKSDYRETMAELHLQYIRTWNAWAHEKGGITRDQAHGAPANLLDVYAAADIPETETFGSTPFKIPGLRRLPENVRKDIPNPLVLKFASSAAHVSGKPLVASETCTWLREHFKTALSQAKPEVDQLFLSGINHIFYHGSPYSPKDAPWPGWNFYAATHFQPTNTLWRDFPKMNEYVARCQSILQSGKPANDILLYWPVYDIWHKFGNMVKLLTVHNTDWLTDFDFGAVAKQLKSDGYTFDYISDDQLQKVGYSDTGLQIAGINYKIILLPQVGHIPLRTWKKLIALAKNGATIIIHKKLPADVPGLHSLKARQKDLQMLFAKISFQQDSLGIRSASIGKGKILMGINVAAMLQRTGVEAEAVAKTGVGFIKRKSKDGYYYFFANQGNKTLDAWVPLSVSFQSAVLLDPLTGATGVAATRRKNGASEVYLRLQPDESCFVRTFSVQKVQGPQWRYFQEKGDPFEITGKWKVDFVQGGPVLPKSCTTKILESWTTLGDDDAKRFAGTARYSISFDLPAADTDDWILDLGRVCESAEVKINGREAGTLWCLPFRMPAGKYLHKGKNLLEIEVTNLAINRIIDLDKRGVDWKKFFFVNIDYKPFDASGWKLMDSGLMGPVRLLPVKEKRF